jgi:hypothetical protein
MSWVTRRPSSVPEPAPPVEEQDPKQFMNLVISSTFSKWCKCEECSPGLYWNYPWSCNAEHKPTDLVVEPNAGPSTDCFDLGVQHRFEALHLVKAAIESFTRERHDMSMQQRQALRDFRSLVELDEFFVKLNVPDCRTRLKPKMMSKAMALLNTIFFLGALPHIYFEWHLAPECMSGICHAVCFHLRNWTTGAVTVGVRMHPVKVQPSRQLSLASQRLGVLLHEMIHGYLESFGCKDCTTAAENMGTATGGHGRAWHLLATAIEKAAPNLLEIDDGATDLGRLQEMQGYYSQETAPSIHDVERYGFLKHSQIL